MRFPTTRLRRLRQSAALRNLVRETRLTPESLVYPLFVCPGKGVRRPVSSMPGVANLSVDELVKEAREAHGLGIPAVILFGLPEKKDEAATGAWEDNGIVQQAARALKRELPELLVIGDVCLCEYMSHGHCGVVRSRTRQRPPGPRVVVAKSAQAATAAAAEAMAQEFEIANDETLEILAKTAVSLVHAGVDMVAPSDMMDGRVAAIRQALDAAGSSNAPILSYAAKFASAFYGPFREAADSAPQFGDRRSYQMDSANGREALREMELDAREGADILMVKPAITSLDLLARARQHFELPLAAYQVSGEYAMLEAAAQRGWLDRRAAALETLTAIARAGADVIMTYFAADAARWLAEDPR